VNELLGRPNVHETLYNPLRNKVRCGVCERRCLISPGEVGFCKTRMNIDNALYTLVYGDISSISANPIEKKPFFHFWPGSYALTGGTWGCNFTCPWCQNYALSKRRPEPLKARYMSPKTFVDMIPRTGCRGSSISFNEPTMLFEYALDVFSMARERGLYNTYVSNGYMTSEALRLLRKAGMNAIKFDVKGDKEAVARYCNADVDVVWRNVRESIGLGMHVEVVVLVIPGVNDSDEDLRAIAGRHVKEAGIETPLHFTRFYPAYHMTDRPPTPVETLERAHAIAVKAGVRYVYVGNVLGHRWENTYCPECGEMLIERSGFAVAKYRITEDEGSGGKRCPVCGLEIPIIGRYTPPPTAITA